MTVLIAAASKHGATGEIAARIGAHLVECGIDVEVKKLGQVADVSAYDAFVIGSGIYLGNWLKEARRFLDAHAAELALRPTWLFASGSIVGDPPIGDDPNALRAGLADRLVEMTHAREHKLFAGKLNTSTLGFLEKAAVRGAHANEGDHRDWQTIDDWAATMHTSSSRARSAPALHRQSDRRDTLHGKIVARRLRRREAMRRLLDALLLIGSILSGPVSREPVRALDDESRRPLAGDDVLADVKGHWTNAITIRGRPGEIWPWLAQMGCRRAGWYSYDGLDNGGVRSAEEIVPELQRVEVGISLPGRRRLTTASLSRKSNPNECWC